MENKRSFTNLLINYTYTHTSNFSIMPVSRVVWLESFALLVEELLLNEDDDDEIPPPVVIVLPLLPLLPIPFVSAVDDDDENIPPPPTLLFNDDDGWCWELWWPSNIVVLDGDGCTIVESIENVPIGGNVFEIFTLFTLRIEFILKNASPQVS